MAGADQNDVGRVFVQVLYEVANRLAVDVKLLHHAETVVLSSPDALEHLASLLPGAKQDEAFLQIGTGHPTAADQLPQLLFRQNRHHTDGGKQKENRAGQLNLEHEDAKDDAQRDKHRRLDQRPEGLSATWPGGAGVKALSIEHERGGK